MDRSKTRTQHTSTSQNQIMSIADLAYSVGVRNERMLMAYNDIAFPRDGAVIEFVFLGLMEEEKNELQDLRDGEGGLMKVYEYDTLGGTLFHVYGIMQVGQGFRELDFLDISLYYRELFMMDVDDRYQIDLFERVIKPNGIGVYWNADSGCRNIYNSISQRDMKDVHLKGIAKMISIEVKIGSNGLALNVNEV